MSKGTIFLSGGGNEKQSFFLDEIFLDKIKNFLYIPIALKNNKSFMSDPSKWIDKVLELHNKKEIKYDILLNINDNVDLLKYDAVYIGGGNTWDLINDLNKIDFKKQIIKFYNEGGHIYGGSAGAIILGKYIDIQFDKNNIKYVDNEGFDMLNNASVVCHYGKDDKIDIDNILDYRKIKTIILYEESGVIINANDEIKFIGKKGIMKKSAS